MSVMLEKKDIVNIAVQIEEKGERFYKEAAEKANSAEVKELFSMLSRDESKHREIFLNMLKALNIEGDKLSIEYQNYLKAYTDRLVFEGGSPEVVEKMKNFDQVWALNYAIQRELDSILYYYELKNIVAKSEYDLIDKIISEERSHFEKLTKIKNIIISR